MHIFTILSFAIQKINIVVVCILDWLNFITIIVIYFKWI